MAELGAAWGSESASDKVWPGGRKPQSSPAASPAKATPKKKKKAASAELTAAHEAREKKAADRRAAVEAKRAAAAEVAEAPAAAGGAEAEAGDGAPSSGGKVLRQLLAGEQPEPEPEVDPLEGMDAAAIEAELASRGRVDPKDKKNKPSAEEQQQMLRDIYDDAAGRQYAERLAQVDLPARAYSEARQRLINRMLFPRAAAAALEHGKIEAEIALTKPGPPPKHSAWVEDEDPQPVLLDAMGRWSVPIRTKRRTTGPTAMKAMTPSDFKAREQRVAADALKAMKASNGRKAGGSGNASSSSLGSQPGPRERRAAAQQPAARPRARSMARGAKGAAWKPTHGQAGTGFEIQIGSGLCMEGLGMVRPATAPDRSKLTACVLDRRLRSQQRKLRVSATGLHRPSTAPPTRSTPSPADSAGAGSAGSFSRRSSVSSARSAGSAGSSRAEIMIVEEDGDGRLISQITSPTPSAQGGNSAWLSGNELQVHKLLLLVFSTSFLTDLVYDYSYGLGNPAADASSQGILPLLVISRSFVTDCLRLTG